MSTSLVMHCQKGEVIIQQNELQRDVYKILSGTVGIYTNYGKINEMRAGQRTAPDYIGEIMLLAELPSYCTIVAESAVAVLRVSEADFEIYLQKDVQNALSIVKAMADNLRMIHININAAQLLNTIRQTGAQSAVTLAVLRGLIKPEVTDRLAIHSGKKDVSEQKNAQLLRSICLPGHKDYSNIALPDCSEYLFDKEYTCPNCKRSFHGVRIAQYKLTPLHESMGEERYDFRMIYENFRAEWFDIVTCPHCCFSAFMDTFQLQEPPRKERYVKKLAEVRAALPLNFIQRKNLDTVFMQHYLALLCAEAFHNDLMNKAQLWRNISWLYEDVQDAALQEAALRKTVDAYKMVYSMCDLTPAQSQQTYLIIAGILYHLGEKKDARQWLTQVKMTQHGKPIYANMADRLIQIIREEIDE